MSPHFHNSNKRINSHGPLLPSILLIENGCVCVCVFVCVCRENGREIQAGRFVKGVFGGDTAPHEL